MEKVVLTLFTLFQPFSIIDSRKNLWFLTFRWKTLLFQKENRPLRPLFKLKRYQKKHIDNFWSNYLKKFTLFWKNKSNCQIIKGTSVKIILIPLWILWAKIWCYEMIILGHCFYPTFFNIDKKKFLNLLTCKHCIFSSCY